ncbi:MAG: hypothetical protein OXQ29_03700 [Rhodospirillaceae bacterium]|nr:hypothetical protein [Rhodospirillaceae bacterium]
MHAGSHPHGGPADVSLPDFRFRPNGKFCYVCDMYCRRERELWGEDRVSATPGKRHPICIGGSRARPPEDCGGVGSNLAGQDEAMGPVAMEALRLLAGFAERTAIGKDSSAFGDEGTFCRVETASERCRSLARFPADRRFRAGERLQLMHRQMAFA